MARPDSRLDAEYDPAERHDLDRIEVVDPVRPTRWPWEATCACGAFGPTGGGRTRGEARAWHDAHQGERLGTRP